MTTKGAKSTKKSAQRRPCHTVLLPAGLGALFVLFVRFVFLVTAVGAFSVRSFACAKHAHHEFLFSAVNLLVSWSPCAGEIGAVQ